MLILYVTFETLTYRGIVRAFSKLLTEFLFAFTLCKRENYSMLFQLWFTRT